MSNESLIGQIDAEIARLQRAKTLLGADSSPSTDKRRRGRPKKNEGVVPTSSVPTKKAKRKMSTEGRARIAQAAKKRWAAVRAKKK